VTPRDATIVCLCNGLSEDDIDTALRRGAGRPREIYAGCGCQAQCGKCTRWILALLREAPRRERRA
jgi:bacterioferritin-associated ferredoxin